jgi:hypothetical protein
MDHSKLAKIGQVFIVGEYKPKHHVRFVLFVIGKTLPLLRLPDAGCHQSFDGGKLVMRRGPLGPYCRGHLYDTPELSLLIDDGDRIAQEIAGEATLRRET